jgi:biotin carboxyl carrier protein
MKYVTTIDDKHYTVEILDDHHISLDGKTLEVDFESVSGQPVYLLIVNGKSYEAYVNEEEDAWSVLLHGRQYQALVEDERERRLSSAQDGSGSGSGEFQLKAPMPGLIVAVPVAEGQAVEKGQVLVILESMKMQNELKSPRAGTVTRIRVKAGDSVEQKQQMVVIA